MKKILIASLALLALPLLPVVAQNRAAASERNTPPARAPRSASLTTWQMDPQLSYASNVLGGTITVDFHNLTATLSLWIGIPCPPGEFCPQMIALQTIRLPIQQVYQDSCGSIVVVAQTARMIPDLPRETLTIIDATDNRCMKPAPGSPTMISYDTTGGFITGQPAATHSILGADSLRRR